MAFPTASGAALVAVTLLADSLGDGGPTAAGLVGRVRLGAVLFGVPCSLAGLGVAAVSRNGTIALIVMVVAQPLPLLAVVAVLLAASWLSLRRRDA